MFIRWEGAEGGQWLSRRPLQGQLVQVTEAVKVLLRAAAAAAAAAVLVVVTLPSLSPVL